MQIVNVCTIGHRITFQKNGTFYSYNLNIKLQYTNKTAQTKSKGILHRLAWLIGKSYGLNFSFFFLYKKQIRTKKDNLRARGWESPVPKRSSEVRLWLSNLDQSLLLIKNNFLWLKHHVEVVICTLLQKNIKSASYIVKDSLISFLP